MKIWLDTALQPSQNSDACEKDCNASDQYLPEAYSLLPHEEVQALMYVGVFQQTQPLPCFPTLRTNTTHSRHLFSRLVRAILPVRWLSALSLFRTVLFGPARVIWMFGDRI